MIRLRRLLVEMDSKDLNRILQKIKNEEGKLDGKVRNITATNVAKSVLFKDDYILLKQYLFYQNVRYIDKSA